MSSDLKVQPSLGRQIDSLDGLRGVAVIFVLLSHLSNAKLHMLPFLSFSGIGKVGVWLFFILSAFLLSLQLYSRSNVELLSLKTWKTYFLRRFLRIYPLFIFVMVVSWLLNDKGIFPPLAAPENISDLINRLLLQDAKGVEWSILVEFKFYYIFPIIVMVVTFILRRSLVATLLAFIAGITVATLHAPPPSLVEILPYTAIFLVGSLTAYCYWRFGGAQTHLSQRARIILEVLAGSSFLIVVLLTPSIWGKLVGREIPLNYFHAALTPFAFLWAIFLFGHLHGTGHISRILAFGPLRFVGTISFSLYLLHPPVIHMVADHANLHSSLQALLALAVSGVLASITYFVIERPFLRMPLAKRGGDTVGNSVSLVPPGKTTTN